MKTTPSTTFPKPTGKFVYESNASEKLVAFFGSKKKQTPLLIN